MRSVLFWYVATYFVAYATKIGSELRNIALILDVKRAREVACQIMKEVTDTLVHPDQG